MKTAINSIIIAILVLSISFNIFEARVMAQNNAQTSLLLSKLQPAPVPSYIVSSPYTSIYPPETTTASS